MKTKIVSWHTPDSKPVKQKVNGTVILPPLVFPGLYNGNGSCCNFYEKKLKKSLKKHSEIINNCRKKC
jgi:hypothetical protein